VLDAMVDLYLAQDRLQDARALAQQAIAIRRELQDQRSVARSEDQLAKVALEEGKAAESEQLTREAAPIFEQEKMAGDTSACAAILARALLMQGRINEGKMAADRSLVFAQQTTDRLSRFSAAIASAQVNAQSGKVAEATKALESVLGEASRLGYAGFELEAR